MAALDPPPCLMGGFAEDALVAGRVLRPHADIDWLFERSEMELRLAQAAALGFTNFGVWGEAGPGDPFYLSGRNSDLMFELGIADYEDGALWLKIHTLRFAVDGEQPAAGFRVQLPPDTFEHPLIELEGIRVRPASPLALYQLRVGIASKGSFGPLNDKQRRSLCRLKETFFAATSAHDLAPRLEPLRKPRTESAALLHRVRLVSSGDAQ